MLLSQSIARIILSMIVFCLVLYFFVSVIVFCQSTTDIKQVYRLLNSNRFSQVPWLVYVCAFYQCHVVRKQLQRDGVDNWSDRAVAVWNIDNPHGFVTGE